MMLSPLDTINCSKNTILFIDDKMAEMMAITDSFSALVPSKFQLIISLNKCKTNFETTIQNMTATIDFDSAVIAVSENLESYKNIIKKIRDNIEIEKIYSIDTDDDITCIPGISCNLSYLPHFHIKISSHCILIPTLQNNLIDQIIGTSTQTTKIANEVLFITNKQKISSLNAFSIGALSDSVAKVVSQTRNGEPTANVLLIDRTQFAAPLFLESGALLDIAAQASLFKTLKNKELLQKIFPLGNAASYKVIGDIIGSSSGSIEGLIGKWLMLSDEERKNYVQKYPLLEPMLGDKNVISRLNAQSALFDDPSDDGIIQTLGFQDAVNLIFLAKEINSKSDIEELLNDASNNDPSSVKSCRNVDEILEIINSSTFGRSTQKRASLRNSFALIDLIDNILDVNSPQDPRIQTAGTSLLGRFLSRGGGPSIHSTNKLLVFILGGLSFYEMREIEQIVSTKRSPIDVMLYTDSICSAARDVIIHPPKD